MIRAIVISAVILIILNNASAQAPQFRLSRKSMLKVEKFESAEKKLKVYKKVFHRDSVRFNRRLKRYYEHYEDSLYEVHHSSDYYFPSLGDSLMTLTDSLGRSVSVFRKDIQMIMEDTCNSVKGIRDLGLEGYVSQVDIPDIHKSGLIEKVGGIHLKDVSTLNAININRHNSVDQLKEYSGSGVEQYADKVAAVPSTDSLNGLVQSQISIPQVHGLENARALSDTANAKATLKAKAEELAYKYIEENPAALQQVQRKMSRMMRKYSMVPNSNDLSTAVKRSSLEGRPFRERLFIAGNFQAPNLDPLTIDFSPSIGYRINSRLTSGVGGMYRQSFADSIPMIANAVIGYKFFTCYDVISQFYAYGELAQNGSSVPSIEASPKRRWTTAAFAGLGRKFMIHAKVETTIVLLYNFLYEERDPIYSSPWAIRVGFQSSILGFR